MSISLTFRECDTCASKPGSPQLCVGCLHNRETIARLHNEVARARVLADAPKLAERVLLAEIHATIEKAKRDAPALFVKVFSNDWSTDDGAARLQRVAQWVRMGAPIGWFSEADQRAVAGGFARAYQAGEWV